MQITKAECIELIEAADLMGASNWKHSSVSTFNMGGFQSVNSYAMVWKGLSLYRFKMMNVNSSYCYFNMTKFFTVIPIINYRSKFRLNDVIPFGEKRKDGKLSDIIEAQDRIFIEFFEDKNNKKVGIFKKVVNDLRG